MNEHSRFSDEWNICDIAVISGKRPSGRTVTQGENGRKNCGFFYIKSGSASFCDNDGKTLTAEKEDLVFLPKGKVYKMRYTSPETNFILVNFNLYDLSGKDVCIWNDITVPIKDNELYGIWKIMSKLEQCGLYKNISADLRKKELCYRLFGRIFSLSYASRMGVETEDCISAGVLLLEQTYLENLPVQDFADVCNISVNTFRRMFHKHFGISPVKYRNRLRIDRARELLSEESITVAEVSYACGFENIGYFCRYYRMVTGESPSETRRKNK